MTNERAALLARSFAERFKAHVEPDEVAPGRFGFEVFSKHFGDVSRWTRQDQAWEVVDRVLTREEAEDITLVVLYGPEDVSEELIAVMP